jgi:hypothetical protein
LDPPLRTIYFIYYIGKALIEVLVEHLVKRLVERLVECLVKHLVELLQSSIWRFRPPTPQ